MVRAQATFNGSIPYFKEDSKTYDSWSIGVIFLEILLGTPHVFTVDQVLPLLHRHRPLPPS